jgi:hypothetical protein
MYARQCALSHARGVPVALSARSNRAGNLNVISDWLAACATLGSFCGCVVRAIRQRFVGDDAIGRDVVFFALHNIVYCILGTGLSWLSSRRGSCGETGRVYPRGHVQPAFPRHAHAFNYMPHSMSRFLKRRAKDAQASPENQLVSSEDPSSTGLTVRSRPIPDELSSALPVDLRNDTLYICRSLYAEVVAYTSTAK